VQLEPAGLLLLLLAQLHAALAGREKPPRLLGTPEQPAMNSTLHRMHLSAQFRKLDREQPNSQVARCV
jgi:hypothetical protein